MKEQNRVMKVLQALLSCEFVPDGTLNSINEICQQYNFIKARSFIRDMQTNEFKLLDDTGLGEKAAAMLEENKINFSESFYRRKEEYKEEILQELSQEVFIHVKDFSVYKEKLESVGYFQSSKLPTKEALIRTVTSNVAGVMGYIVFERTEDQQPLEDMDIVEIKGLCQIINDRIENFETAKQLRDEEKQSAYDSLTGLLSPLKFKKKAEMLLGTNNKYAMLCFDIDKFKYINDIWSFETGNEILFEISKILDSYIDHETETCTRLSDDRFAMMFRYDDLKDLEVKMTSFNNMFLQMHEKTYPDIKITIIAGVYIIEENININLIIDRANIARRSIKGSYKNEYKIYNENLENLSEKEKELEKRMLTALDCGEFVPFLQPKFNLNTNEICGAEALARWKSGDKMISPADFIPVFEKNGFITKLDFVIYEEVFKFIKECMDKNYKIYPISLNVSRGHIENINFLSEFLEKMKQYSVPKETIELEITESVFIEDEHILKKFIAEIRQAGIEVSIDDFGTAYSSLNLLKDIVVDVVKIDKSFIDNISEGVDPKLIKRDKVIVKNIINMINELKFKTIFEGIETQEHVDFLREIGCQSGQGYIFAKPMPVFEYEDKYLKC